MNNLYNTRANTLKSTLTRKSALIALATLMMSAGALSRGSAQEASRGTAVVYPIVYSRNSGTETSRKTGVTAMREVLQKAGYTLVSGTVAANTWRQMGLAVPTMDRPASRADLVRFGKALKAQFVVTASLDFNSRSIWVDLGPKTISTATVGIRIADVKQDKIAYSKERVVGRSDEKFDMLKAGGALLLTPLITIVSGGPKTPHEQRAVQIAVVKALHDWVKPGE